jgi:hypothetical protein
VSPPFARWLMRHEHGRTMIRRGFIEPIVRLVQQMGWDQPVAGVIGGPRYWI